VSFSEVALAWEGTTPSRLPSVARSLWSSFAHPEALEVHPVSLGEAKRLVDESKTWADLRESDNCLIDEIVDVAVEMGGAAGLPESPYPPVLLLIFHSFSEHPSCSPGLRRRKIPLALGRH